MSPSVPRATRGGEACVQRNQHRRVSIVLPTYNGSRYLRQSVASVLGQTYTDWELIIVDDCSTDGTPGIIAELVRSDPRIRSVRHETNGKLPAALNSGFALACGEYLTWTSDDNRFRPHALQRMAEYLDSHLGAALVYTGFTKIGDDGRPLGAEHPRPPDVLVESNAVGPCFMYRQSVRAAVGQYADDLFLAEDWEYWLRIYLHFPCEALDEDLYEYRWHDGMLTTTRATEISLAVEKALLRHMPAIRARGRLLACRARLSLARRARRREDRRAWLRHLAHAALLAPALAVRDERGLPDLARAIARRLMRRRVSRTGAYGNQS